MSAPQVPIVGQEVPEGGSEPAEASQQDAPGKGKGRNLKTPLQKEVLEASYQLNPNPTQQHRKALAERLGLTEEQVQSWFQGKRRRDKKKQGEGAAGTPAVSSGTGAAEPGDQGLTVSATTAAGVAGDQGADGPAAASASADAAAAAAEAAQAELLELAKASLPVPFREDGPALAFVFDPVPAPNTKKGMQAAALIAARKRKLAGAADGAGAESEGVAPLDDALEAPAKRPKLEGTGLEGVSGGGGQQAWLQEALQQQAALHATSTQKQQQLAAPSGREQMKADRAKAAAEARQAKEVAKARAQQEREAKKREAQAERERKAEEKRKAAEEKRREKELAKAFMQQERSGRGGSHHHGPPDDLDLEYEALLVRARATAAAQAAARGLDPAAVEPVVPPRPEFPPPYLLLQSAFPPELGDELGPQLIEAWGFVTGFADLLGLPAFSMETFLSALLQGSSSPLLGLVHVLLLRQAQADMEISHATGVLQEPHPADKALVAAATRLEEAWAWGLDPDLWRAHLGPLTWPEVLRQQAIAAGAGGSRVQLKRLAAAAEATTGAEGTAAAAATKSTKLGNRAPKGAMGYEGEDVVSGWTGDGPLKLLLPLRFGESTWMAAAWKVLSEAGPEGLTVAEVVRLIAERGYRHMGGSKNPEASVTGALSRDVLFTRLGPGTYALHSIVTYTQRMQAAGKNPEIERPLHQQQAAGAGGAAAMDVDDSDDEDSEDEEEVVARAPEDPPDAQPWVVALKHGSYDELSLAHRLSALLWLISIVGDGLGVRTLLDNREKEVAALKKQLLEDARAEKKRRQDEAAARAKAASLEAQRRLDQLQRQVAAGESVPQEAMAAAAAAAATLSSAAGLPPPGPSAASAASRAATPTPAPAPTPTPSAAASTAPAAAALSGGTPAAADQQPTDSQQQNQQNQQAADAATPAATATCTAEQQQQQQPGQEGQGTSQQEPTTQAVTSQSQQQQQQQAAEAAAESARRAARAEAIRRLEELNVLRLEPLGMDRRSNRYWLLVAPDFSITSSYTGSADDFANTTAGMAADANAGRIWVESASNGRWRLLLKPQQLDQLKQVLEPRGVREGGLHGALLRVEGAVRAAMPGKPFVMPPNKSELPPDEQQAVRAASQQWFKHQPLLARCFTSQEQEDSIRSLLTQPSAQPADHHRADDDAEGNSSMQLVVSADDDGQVQQSHGAAAAPEVVTLKQDMLRVEALVQQQMQALSGFPHEQWVQSVASAPDLMALRTCLAQLEAALVDSDRQATTNAAGGAGGPGGGAGKGASVKRLLCSDWSRITAATPCVKGAWLQCGAEVPAAIMDQQLLLVPNIPGATAAAAQASAEGGVDAAAAAAGAGLQQQEPPQQQEEAHAPAQQQQSHWKQRQDQHQPADLSWLPATVPALALRLSALDACLLYPQLNRQLIPLDVGREIIGGYRYIIKPCPIFEPATLEQLLSQERAAAAAAAAAAKLQQQQEQQPAASAGTSTVVAGSTEELKDSAQQQEQQEQEQQQEQQQDENPEQQKQKPLPAASDILALVHPQPSPAHKRQKQSAKKQQQQQLVKPPPTLDSVLSKPLRVAYGYSLQGRGLLQLIRGLPPFPDWLQKAELDEFKLPVNGLRAAVKAAQEDGTFNLTLEDIRNAAAAKEQAAKEAAAAAAAAKAAAAEAAAAEAAAAAAAGKPPAKAGKGGMKLKLHVGGKGGKPAGTAAASGGQQHKQAAGGVGSSKQQAGANGAAARGAATGSHPKLKLKFKSRESSPAAPAAPAGGAGGKAAGGGRLRLRQTAQVKQEQAGGQDMSRKERIMRQLGLRTLSEAELAEEVQQLQDYSEDDD